MTRMAGVVLAGGLATRMGGGQKALLELAGQPLIDRVLHRLKPQVADIAINANGDTTGYERFAHPIIRDETEDFQGPLAGVLAGMRWAQDRGFDQIVTVAGDTPFFPPDLTRRLADAASPIALAATQDPERGALRQPTFGLWPVSLADDLAADLAQGIRKIVLWADKHGVGTAVFEAEPFDPFFNVNSPDDMVAAEKLVAEFAP